MSELTETIEKVEQMASPGTVPVEPTQTTEQAEFEEAVAQGLALVAVDTTNKMQLGELADSVQARYGEATLQRFADRIDVGYETVKRLRTVYRAYKDQDIGATSPSWGVLSTLAAVENRAELIRANPTMTVAVAEELWRAARAAERAASEAKATNPTDSVAGDVAEADEPEADEPEADDDDEADADADDDDDDDEEEEDDADDEPVSLNNAETEFRTKYQDRSHARDDRGFVRKVQEFAQTVLTEFGHQQETVDADILRDVLEDPQRDISKVRTAGEQLQALADDWDRKFATVDEATVDDATTLEPVEN